MDVNPWQVESIEAFSGFLCPECTYNSKQKTYLPEYLISGVFAGFLTVLIAGAGNVSRNRSEASTLSKSKSVGSYSLPSK